MDLDRIIDLPPRLMERDGNFEITLRSNLDFTQADQSF